jgi:GABA(A) receptor-associated protein
MTKIDYTKKTFSKSEHARIKEEVDVILRKYPSYIPIIVRYKTKHFILSKTKYLVSGEMTIGQFIFILRKKITNLTHAQGLFLFVNNTLPPSSHLLYDIYNQYKDPENNMLFMTLCIENTFG